MSTMGVLQTQIAVLASDHRYLLSCPHRPEGSDDIRAVCFFDAQLGKRSAYPWNLPVRVALPLSH